MSEAPIFNAGDTIAGKYRVVEVLGEGGMGTVICAEHVHLKQRVAIKLMKPELAENAEYVGRFMREGQAAVRLHNPHVAKVFDVGRLDSGAPFMVMEFLRGRDLAAVLDEKETLPVEQAVDYLLQACEALAEAHGAGVVHRDLKPANMFLTQDAYGKDSIKLLDFGISKLTEVEQDGAPALTHTGTVMGSPTYMSPEQMQASRHVDHRADIWALGCIWYELLTGRLAWPGQSFSEVCYTVGSQSAPSIRDERPDVSEQADALLHRCLAKSPSERFATVVELARALAPLGGPKAAEALERVLHVATTAGSPPVSSDVEPAASAAAVPESLKATVRESVQSPSAKDGAASADISTTPTVVAKSGDHPQTTVAWGTQRVDRERPTRRLLPFVVAGTVAVAAAGAVIALSRSADHPDATIEPDSSTPVAPTSPMSSAPTSATTASNAQVVAPAVAPTDMAVDAAPSAPMERSEPTPTPKATAAPRPTPPPRPRPKRDEAVEKPGSLPDFGTRQ